MRRAFIQLLLSWIFSRKKRERKSFYRVPQFDNLGAVCTTRAISAISSEFWWSLEELLEQQRKVEQFEQGHSYTWMHDGARRIDHHDGNAGSDPAASRSARGALQSPSHGSSRTAATREAQGSRAHTSWDPGSGPPARHDTAGKIITYCVPLHLLLSLS
jgi:hypothetical protein